MYISSYANNPLNINALKHLYAIIPLIIASLITSTLSAQSYPSSYTFRSTSGYATSYQLPTGNYQSTIQFANGNIRTSAANLNGSTTLDKQSAYIPTNNPTGPQRIAPPIHAPLHFDKQVILLILLLSTAYAYSIYRKTKVVN